jgi:hypothetical protein
VYGDEYTEPLPTPVTPQIVTPKTSNVEANNSTQPPTPTTLFPEQEQVEETNLTNAHAEMVEETPVAEVLNIEGLYITDEVKEETNASNPVDEPASANAVEEPATTSKKCELFIIFKCNVCHFVCI